MSTASFLKFTRWFFGFAILGGMTFSACNCQRQENIAAKERLSAPPPKDPYEERSKESLEATSLGTNESMRHRINRMNAREIYLRLKSYKLKTSGRLFFDRSDWKMNSKERAYILQSESGDFSVDLETGDGGLQRLVFANDVLFLKNQNGKWRASRDATGERNELLDDSIGMWRSFYDLIQHALVFDKIANVNYEGQDAVTYKLRLPNEKAEALALGAKDSGPRIVDNDANLGEDGYVEESAEERNKRISGRVKTWRDKARPVSGSGEMTVSKSGVILKVVFKGEMAVGDGPIPATLKVEIDHKMTDIGAANVVKVPQDAIEEVVRKKWPVKPYERLEKAGILPKRVEEEDAEAVDLEKVRPPEPSAP